MVNRDEIEKRRKSLGLSQEQAARAANIGDAAKWNDIISGRNDNPGLKTLEGMARALKWSTLAKMVKVDKA